MTRLFCVLRYYVYIMPKKALSVTLDQANVAWLKGRAQLSGGNLSDALDKLVTHARTGGGTVLGTNTSVVGMVDLSEDPTLSKADAAVRDGFAEYISRQFMVHEDPPATDRRARAKNKRG
jgi:hypothetical protein